MKWTFDDFLGSPNNFGWRVADEKDNVVAYVIKRDDAAKIAAAPELFEVAHLYKRLMANLMTKGNVDWGRTFDIDFLLMNDALIKCDAAIAKATGGES